MQWSGWERGKRSAPVQENDSRPQAVPAGARSALARRKMRAKGAGRWLGMLPLRRQRWQTRVRARASEGRDDPAPEQSIPRRAESTR